MQSTFSPKVSVYRIPDIFNSAWDEIHDVFGDGHDYDWALNVDDDDGVADDIGKPEMKYQDVKTFEITLLF